ncbi:MAG: CAP domain-containing protein [Acidobacteriota bacterium]|nr:CAP domain-containing protein [Acidobacteriota bacterium]
MMPGSASRILLLALLATAGSGRFAVAQRTNVSVDPTTIAEQYLLSAANQEREARGLPLLHRSPQLAHAAAGHARVMAAHESISHQFAGEPELTERGASAGVPFSVISENVAQAPSVVQIHDMWMRSEHHRTNLLDPAVDSVGISVIARSGELYAVEDFAKTVRPVSLLEQETAIGALVAHSGRIDLANDPETVTAARRTCSMSTGYAGNPKPWFVMRFTSDSLTQLPKELASKMASGRYSQAAVGACRGAQSEFTSYNFAVLLYP